MVAKLTAAREWAVDEFGTARLGRIDRTRRLIDIAARWADNPSAIVSKSITDRAEREGAYRFLETDDIDPDEVARSSYRATLARCVGSSFAYVPVDGTSLNISDRARTKGTGPIGARKYSARGFQIMSSLAVTEDGVPQGLCAQAWWTRDEKAVTRESSKRKLADKETKHWVNVLRQTRELFKGSGCKPWFQLDRGGDAWPVLLEAHDDESWLTVRASCSRRLRGAADEREYLWPVVERSRPIGRYTVDVPESKSRKARKANLEVRAIEVTLDLRNHQTKTRMPARVWAVLAKEMSETAKDDEPLEWMLLTTFPAETMEAAAHVLFGYTQRWRIEEFHKAWKSGACGVEGVHLESANGIRSLAVILAAVGVRLLRLTYLARVQPSLPASVEFSATEIRAAAYLKRRRTVRTGAVTMATMLTWIAELGGYIGRSSGGPPGVIVLCRGLQSVATVARALRTQEGIDLPEPDHRSG